MCLVYAGEDGVSMEEQRASHAKYRMGPSSDASTSTSVGGLPHPVGNKSIMDKLSKLDKALGDRLAFLKP